MLFCFGLFALLLYNTVVANAECSYTYRNSSHQHIEAQSSDYEKQGFQRCEFLIQLGDPQQQIELNFTRLSGFGARNASQNGAPEGPGHKEKKKKKKEEEAERTGSRGKSAGRVDEGGSQMGAGHSESPSSQPRVVLPPTTTTVTHAVVLGSKLSSIVSSPPPPRKQQHGPTHNTDAYANTNTSSDTVVKTPLLPSSSSSSSLWTTSVPPGGEGWWEEDEGSGPCLPVVEIREVTEEGQEKTRHRICRQHRNTQTPIVFHYASSVRIVYEWRQKQSSGFTLYFDFSSSEYGKCVHKCDGSRCLTEAELLCNGQADCLDHSDEGSPACPLSTSISSSDSLEVSHLVQMVVIPLSVLVVGVVLCVVCLLARRRRHHHHHRHLTPPRWPPPGPSPSSSSSAAVASSPSPSPSPQGDDTQTHHLHHHHLHHHLHHHHHHHLHHQLRGNGHVAVHLDCPRSPSSERLAAPPGGCCSNAECPNEQAVALLPSAKHAHKHAHKALPAAPAGPQCGGVSDPEVGLPPNIPVSPDGEEGYSASQLRLLDRRSHAAHSELFKPPPNKTVFDRESPPPYSLTPSPGTYGCGSPLAPPPSPPHSVGRGTAAGGGSYLLPERVVRDSEGQPVVSRCYTMFSGPPHPRPRSDPPSAFFPRPYQRAPAGARPQPPHQPVSAPVQRGCPDPDPGAPSTLCDASQPAPLPPPPPRVFGACRTAEAASPFALHPSSSSSSSSSPACPFNPLPSNGNAPPRMPSETVPTSRSSASSLSRVDWRRRRRRRSGDSDGRGDSGVGEGGDGDCLSAPLETPPSYQMVLSQDLWEGRGGGSGGPSPSAVPLTPDSSPSPSASIATSATSSTSTTTSTFNNNNNNNSGDVSGV